LQDVTLGVLPKLIKVVLYLKRDQKVCLNMVRKDQLSAIALERRKGIVKVLLIP